MPSMPAYLELPSGEFKPSTDCTLDDLDAAEAHARQQDDLRGLRDIRKVRKLRFKAEERP